MFSWNLITMVGTPALVQAVACEVKDVDNHKGSEEAWVDSLKQVGIEITCFFVAFAAICWVFDVRHRKGVPMQRILEKPCKDVPKAATDLQAWRSHKRTGSIRGQELHHWAGRVMATEPEAFVEEFIGHLAQMSPPDHAVLPGEVSILMEVAAKAGRPEIVEAVMQAAKERLGVVEDPIRAHHCRLTAHASCGSEHHVEELLRQERAQAADGTVALRSLAIVVRGYMRAGKLQGAILQLQEMHRLGHEIPPRAVSKLFAAAAKAGTMKETYTSLGGQIHVPEDAVTALLEFAFQTDDFKFARDVEQVAVDQGTALNQEALEAILKLSVKVDNAKSIEFFQRMQSAGFMLCEGLCRYLIARCADSQNVQLAESIAEYLRGRQEMTFPCYKTLMKVYAYNGCYSKACDLYNEIKQHDWEPDAVMYGSLMKFAVKSGRTDLAHELSEKVQGGDIRNYMWLIRSAGQDGDVKRAVDTFRKLQSTQPELVDVMAYNVTIDACASNNDIALAQQLLEEMRQVYPMNKFTYNTMMKGHCAVGDLDSARRSLQEMEESGITPDVASFSCLLSGAAKQLDCEEALRIIAEMDRRKLRLDSCVVTTMMRLARHLPNARDAYRALSILDRPDAFMFDDEIVLNTVLDACVYHRDCKHLSRAVDAYSSRKVRASVRTYGLLIQACATLQRTHSCWTFWKEMVDRRGIIPNDITLACMIDALLEAQKIEDALALFQAWKAKVASNNYSYSSLVSGLPRHGYIRKAVELTEEACARVKPSHRHNKNFLTPSALKELLTALQSAGQFHELGYSLVAKCRKAGMIVEDKWLAQ